MITKKLSKKTLSSLTHTTPITHTTHDLNPTDEATDDGDPTAGDDGTMDKGGTIAMAVRDPVAEEGGDRARPVTARWAKVRTEFNFSEFLALAHKVIDDGDDDSMNALSASKEKWEAKLGSLPTSTVDAHPLARGLRRARRNILHPVTLPFSLLSVQPRSEPNVSPALLIHEETLGEAQRVKDPCMERTLPRQNSVDEVGVHHMEIAGVARGLEVGDSSTDRVFPFVATSPGSQVAGQVHGGSTTIATLCGSQIAPLCSSQIAAPVCGSQIASPWCGLQIEEPQSSSQIAGQSNGGLVGISLGAKETTSPRSQVGGPSDQAAGVGLQQPAAFPASGLFIGKVPLSTHARSGMTNTLSGDYIADAFNNSSRKTLSYVAPVIQNDEVVVRPTLAMSREGARRWALTAAGYFLARKSYFHHLNEYARSSWPAVLDVTATTHGFYFFRFKTVAAMEEVIEGGPWLFSGPTYNPPTMETGYGLA
ncbi:UNVERIFIED_CONTAM: hypothetical protein Slati_3104100 [Sesamum latifolium]|uniref:DUF4283 domain-containing protein n=1 Tax=Sesamum latifolium TaxID=2727402 RepID=A0AAW2UWD6_9LAMI